MYDELVKRLREADEKSMCDECGLNLHTGATKKGVLFAEAADAIEELSKQIEAVQCVNIGDLDCDSNQLCTCMGIVRKRLEAAEKQPRWIPVTERLPENGERALVMRFDYVTNTPFYDLLWLDKGEWWNRRYTGDYAVTHWQPLPDPPKEEA